MDRSTQSIIAIIFAAIGFCTHGQARGQFSPTTDPRLKVELVAQNLSTNFGDIVSAWCFVDYSTILLASRADGTIRRLDLIPGQIVTPGLTVGDLPIIANNPADSQSEFGVQSLTPHPQFATNRLIYARYSRSLNPPADTPQANITEGVTPMSNVIERLVWDPAGNGGVGTLTPLSSSSLIRTSPVLYRYHQGGHITFAPDGTMFVPYGNQRLGFDLALNTSDFSFNPDVGAIVRLKDDGSLPINNPFTPGPGTPPNIATPANAAAWWSYGHRNIFGLAIDPATGTLWCTDNGEASWDEINRVPAGLNSGSLAVSGPTGHPRQTQNNPALRTINNSFYKNPEFSFYTTCGITGIVFLHGSSLGPAYDHRVIVGEYNWHYLWWFRLNPARDAFEFTHTGLQDKVDDSLSFNRNPIGTEVEELLLATNIGGPFNGVVGIRMGMDGLPYMLTANGRLYRITRACWADIADDAGVPHGPTPGPNSNGGVNEGDFNAFFMGFFSAERYCDIADDAGNAPPRGPNGGVNEGDFNCFFMRFFDGCA